MKHQNEHLPTRARSEAREDDAFASTGTRILRSARELHDAVNACRRCGLWEMATQGVAGEGRTTSPLMLVGEQPGAQEDLRGRPFVGPAGTMLDRALEEAGVDRRSVYVTNAVKHFKFEPRGKRRMHVKPGVVEIRACNWWLQEEIRLVSPKLVVALGATAARALLGRAVTITETRGSPLKLTGTVSLWVTIHPSSLLRMPDETRRHAEYERFVQDLAGAHRYVSRH